MDLGQKTINIDQNQTIIFVNLYTTLIINLIIQANLNAQCFIISH